jgi:hypothetical protein
MQFVLLAASLLPQAIQAGRNVMELIKLIQDVAKSDGDVTDAQWAALKAIEDDLRDKLHSDDR